VEIQLIDNRSSTYLLKRDSNNYIRFCPKRGGLITHWVSKSESILYFDESRFLDYSKSVRGGIPILFPICGMLNCKESIFGNNFYPMHQHGFARDLEWEFYFCEKNKSLSLFLIDNSRTRKYYPFQFQLQINILLGNSSLNFEILIQNNSDNQMPVNFGMHPYFNISNYSNIKFLNYPINCQNQITNTIDCTSSVLGNLSNGIDILMYSMGEVSFSDFGYKRNVILRNPCPFDLSVIWTDPPRKMICVEPWTSPRDSLIDGFRRIIIPPLNFKKLSASIEIHTI
tara:strand:- start:822 stop:1673 length:852 start_codon:yes stop_codon:yes gene_type:complete